MTTAMTCGGSPRMVAQSEPLRSLETGQRTFVCGVIADARTGKRLADLGFIGGAAVEMVRPGRPCIVRLNGTRIGLGARFQELVLVDQPAR